MDASQASLLRGGEERWGLFLSASHIRTSAERELKLLLDSTRSLGLWTVWTLVLWSGMWTSQLSSPNPCPPGWECTWITGWGLPVLLQRLWDRDPPPHSPDHLHRTPLRWILGHQAVAVMCYKQQVDCVTWKCMRSHVTKYIYSSIVILKYLSFNLKLKVCRGSGFEGVPGFPP